MRVKESEGEASYMSLVVSNPATFALNGSTLDKNNFATPEVNLESFS